MGSKHVDQGSRRLRATPVAKNSPMESLAERSVRSRHDIWFQKINGRKAACESSPTKLAESLPHPKEVGTNRGYVIRITLFDVHFGSSGLYLKTKAYGYDFKCNPEEPNCASNYNKWITLRRIIKIPATFRVWTRKKILTQRSQKQFKRSSIIFIYLLVMRGNNKTLRGTAYNNKDTNSSGKSIQNMYIILIFHFKLRFRQKRPFETPIILLLPTRTIFGSLSMEQ